MGSISLCQTAWSVAGSATSGTQRDKSARHTNPARPPPVPDDRGNSAAGARARARGERAGSWLHLPKCFFDLTQQAQEVGFQHLILLVCLIGRRVNPSRRPPIEISPFPLHLALQCLT